MYWQIDFLLAHQVHFLAWLCDLMTLDKAHFKAVGPVRLSTRSNGNPPRSDKIPQRLVDLLRLHRVSRSIPVTLSAARNHMERLQSLLFICCS